MGTIDDARRQAQEILKLSIEPCRCIAIDLPKACHVTRADCPKHGKPYLLITVEVSLEMGEEASALAAAKEQLAEAVSILAAGRPAEGKVRVLRGKFTLATTGDIE